MIPVRQSRSESLCANAFVHAESNFACIAYTCGSLYLGQVDAQLSRSGLGMLFLPRLGFYFGKFQSNLAHDFGLLKEPNGNQTLGYFSQGTLHGRAVKYRLGSRTVRVEYYERSKLRRAEPAKIRVLSSLTDSEVRKVDELFSEFQGLLKPLKTLKILEVEEGIYMGAIGDGVPEGVGLLLSRGCEVHQGLFLSGKLHGPGRRLRRGVVANFDIFLNGFSMSSPSQSLDLAEAALARPLIEKRPSFYLPEDALFFPASQLQRKRRQFTGTEQWFNPHLLKGGLDLWQKAFFCPLSLDVKGKCSPMGDSKADFTAILAKGNRLLNETGERLRERSAFSSRIISAERDNSPALDRQKNTHRDSIKNDYFTSHLSMNNGPWLLGQQKKSTNANLSQFDALEQFKKTQISQSSSARTKEVPLVKESKLNLSKRKVHKNTHLSILEILEKSKLNSSKRGTREEPLVKLKAAKSFDLDSKDEKLLEREKEKKGSVVKKGVGLGGSKVNVSAAVRLNQILKK